MASSKHLNYIGCKHTLLDWLTGILVEKTGFHSFEGKRFADLFSGTGVVAYHFRNKGATVLSNDIEPCSYIVTKAMTECVYSDSVREMMETLNKELEDGLHQSTVGFLTRQYSPYETCKRKFFTVDNAKRMDYVRKQIEEREMPQQDKLFLLASLVVSADAVANCASVYGAYLKQFKKTAEKHLQLVPIHLCTTPSTSTTTQRDVLDPEFQIEGDIVYLDPPYNQRQYSKNYFPLSLLVLKPEEQDQLLLTGETGIPPTCFTSSFSSKRGVKQAFESLFAKIQAKWVFLSYNSESLLEKDLLLEMLKRYGTVTLVEKPYKRFKSNSKKQDVEREIKEYVFCLERE